MDLLAGDAGNGWSVWPCALPACAELRLWRASRPGCETRRRWWRGRWCECAAIAWRLRRPVPMKECACGSTRRLELRAPDPRQRASPFGILRLRRSAGFCSRPAKEPRPFGIPRSPSARVFWPDGPRIPPNLRGSHETASFMPSPQPMLSRMGQKFLQRDALPAHL